MTYQDDRFLVLVENNATGMASRRDALADGAAMSCSTGRWLKAGTARLGDAARADPVDGADRRTQRLSQCCRSLRIGAGRCGWCGSRTQVSDHNAPYLAPTPPSTRPAPRSRGRPSEEPSVMPTPSTSPRCRPRSKDGQTLHRCRIVAGALSARMSRSTAHGTTIVAVDRRSVRRSDAVGECSRT